MTTNITANPIEPGDDELERLALEECIRRQRVDRQINILVLPSGQCELAFKFARLGADVTVADNPALAKSTQGRILAAGLTDRVTFQANQLPSLPPSDDDHLYDLVVLRRGLCSLHYSVARQLIRDLQKKMRIGGRLYISILGLHSELGEGYPGREQSVYERLAPLSPLMAKKYDIDHPVCLYSERDLFLLLLEAGASVLRTSTSTYGNVKAVAGRV
ncbi:MAG: class I SAM-dependent methyltransferase [Dechloromonas sp.]|nr:class I SAM-dependent methyltransferase [Dechloromonas sp.]